MKNGRIAGIVASLFLFLHLNTYSETTVSLRLQPFDYKGVSLEQGFAKKQLDEVHDYYLAISNDDLLKDYRRRAGKPAPGNQLTGWYGSDTFHVFGQIVSGLSRLYAATGDPACRDKANALIAGWAECIAPDGYFYADPKPNAQHYIYDKFLWGLIDNYLYCGNQESLKHLPTITTWAEKHLDRARLLNHTKTEWYTLSENLYRAYEITGDERYLEFAKVWHYSDFWEVFGRKGDIFHPGTFPPQEAGYHAYSHVNTLGGAAAAFKQSGERKYLDTILNAYDFLQNTQLWASGGYGPDERLLPTPELNNRLQQTHHSCEVQCGTWAAFKLSRYLMSFTGDARYGDWVERLMINGIGATPPMTRDGRVYYYADYCVHGAEKFNSPIPWSCCTGTRPQAVADLVNQVWYHDENSLCVNLYTAATVDWKHSDTSITVRQDTDFPRSDKVRFVFTAAKPENFTFKMRVPKWLGGPLAAKINGNAAELTTNTLNWATIERSWSSGDVLEVKLPMKAWTFRRLDGPFALLYGPVLLALQTSEPRSLGKLSPEQLTKELQFESGKFSFVGLPEVEVRPLYEIPVGERYFVYVSPETGTRLIHGDLLYRGRWDNNGRHHVSREPGSAVEFEFQGTGFRWHGNKYDDAGMVEVMIDGNIVAVVDQYGPKRNEKFVWSSPELAAGNHRVRLTLLPESNEKSRGRFVNIESMEVVAGE